MYLDLTDKHIYESPLFTKPEWRCSNTNRIGEALRFRATGELIASDTNRLTNELGEKRTIMENDVVHGLKQRVNDVDFWIADLTEAGAELDHQNKILDQYQKALTKALFNYREPSLIAERCLQMRGKRIGIEHVDDDPQVKLREELRLNTAAMDTLKRVLEQVDEQMRINRAQKFVVDQNLSRKEAALRHEQRCIEMNVHTPGLAYISAKEMQLPFNSPDPKQWRAQANLLRRNALGECDNSRKIIGVAKSTLDAVLRDVTKAFESTNNALKLRIEEENSALKKLSAQHEKVQEQRSVMLDTLKQLRIQLDGVEGPLKLAHSRIAERNKRPIEGERLNDEVHHQLLSQVAEWQRTADMLQRRIDEAATALRDLNRQCILLQEEIDNKTNSICIDEVQCLELRQVMRLYPELDTKLVNNLTREELEKNTKANKKENFKR